MGWGARGGLDERRHRSLGAEWVRWGGFPAFWNQAVRWTFGGRLAGGLVAAVRPNGEQARLTVDAQDESGAFRNGLALTANVVGPTGETQTLELRPTAPGRYEASFTPQTEGAYFIGVGTTAGGETTADGRRPTADGEEPSSSGQPSVVGGPQTTAGWVLGYSPEYAELSGNPALLASLAAQTGGRALDTAEGTGPGPAAVFAHDLDAAPAAQPIWPWLTLAAALLLPLDVAARRLTFTKRDWAQAWAKVTADRRRPTATPERTETMAQMLRAKEEATVGRVGNPPAPVTNDERRATDGDSTRRTTDDQPLTTNDQRPTPTDQPLPDETLAARLRKTAWINRRALALPERSSLQRLYGSSALFNSRCDER
jgi:hypothetical protein